MPAHRRTGLVNVKSRKSSRRDDARPRPAPRPRRARPGSRGRPSARCRTRTPPGARAPPGLRDVSNAHRVHRVVGLAAEEELLGEDAADVVERRRSRQSRTRRSSRGPRRDRSGTASARRDGRCDRSRSVGTVLADQLARAARGRGWPGRSARWRRGCASRSGREMSAYSVRGPGDAALVEREPQVGEAHRDTPPKNSDRADGLAAGREVPDVVGDVVGRRRAAAVPDAGGVEGRRHAELGAAPPQRVVVVLGVEAERVDPAAPPGRPRGPATMRSDQSRRTAPPAARARPPRTRAPRSPRRACSDGMTATGSKPIASTSAYTPRSSGCRPGRCHAAARRRRAPSG